MTLVPESIQGSNTVALDGTFKQRLITMGAEQLLICIEEERDLVKLGLWMEMFGIPAELLPEDFDEFAFRELLQSVLKIYNLSGTVVAVELIAKALGVPVIEVATGVFDLRYDGGSTYNGLCCHREKDFQTFAIDIHLDLEEAKRERFEELFKKLFYTFMPVGIYLRHINYKGIFDQTFCPTFN